MRIRVIRGKEDVDFRTRRLDHIYRDPHNGEDVRLYLHYGDIGSSGNLADIIRQVGPDEIYHLAAQSHVSLVPAECSNG